MVLTEHVKELSSQIPFERIPKIFVCIRYRAYYKATAECVKQVASVCTIILYVYCISYTVI